MVGYFVVKVFVMGRFVGRTRVKIREILFIVVIFVGPAVVVGYFVDSIHSSLCIKVRRPINKGHNYPQPVDNW